MMDLGCPSQYRESATSIMRESRVDVSYFHVTSPMAPSQTRSKAWRRLEGIGGAGIGEVWLLEILVLLLCSCDRVCLGNNSSRNADGAVDWEITSGDLAVWGHPLAGGGQA